MCLEIREATQERTKDLCFRGTSKIETAQFINWRLGVHISGQSSETPIHEYRSAPNGGSSLIIKNETNGAKKGYHLTPACITANIASKRCRILHTQVYNSSRFYLFPCICSDTHRNHWRAFFVPAYGEQQQHGDVEYASAPQRSKLADIYHSITWCVE